ncbi:hypothetical protein EVAR_50700_1 [Eumeta japonica]|uniref:Uncharacterized protein n=1 Tax=Eumeta variegata TaxID=151549 RepID=A0A4C1YQK9_EUMVA|nr:hypothetical protein EVAR_50700_1 [Eumeta japonica]
MNIISFIPILKEYFLRAPCGESPDWKTLGGFSNEAAIEINRLDPSLHNGLRFGGSQPAAQRGQDLQDFPLFGETIGSDLYCQQLMRLEQEVEKENGRN